MESCFSINKYCQSFVSDQSGVLYSERNINIYLHSRATWCRGRSLWLLLFPRTLWTTSRRSRPSVIRSSVQYTGAFQKALLYGRRKMNHQNISALRSCILRRFERMSCCASKDSGDGPIVRLSNGLKDQCGNTTLDVFRFLKINSADTLLSINDLFAFFEQDSQDFLEMKRKVGITLTNGTFLVKTGPTFQLNSFIGNLRTLRQSNTLAAGDVLVPSSLLDQHPALRLIIHFFDNYSSHASDSGLKFKYIVLETIISNHYSAKGRYRYPESLRNFAACLHILGGRNVYEFIRINIPGLLPSSPIVHALLDSTAHRVTEADIRYDLMVDHLSLQQTNFVFISEDCTAVIPRIVYDVHSNAFIGFTPTLVDGLPRTNTFSTESFHELEQWFSTRHRSHLLSIHILQPINSFATDGVPFILSAYGTDNRFTTLDILMRWITIINQCDRKGVKTVGCSTDCDARYLKSMRLLMGFFADMPNQQFHLRDHAFTADVPKVISSIRRRNLNLLSSTS